MFVENFNITDINSSIIFNYTMIIKVIKTNGTAIKVMAHLVITFTGTLLGFLISFHMK